MKYVTKDSVKKNFPGRPPWSRKGDFGKLLVIGGSRRYTGAPALSALSALRAGCDLVTVAAPERAANTVASFSPDLITEPFAGNHFNNWHTRSVLELANQFDAVVIGGGLGRKRETYTFVQNFLSRLQKPCVIDADALHAVGINRKLSRPEHVLTPHSSEFQLLSGNGPSKNVKERANQSSELARHMNCTILLKGHVDVISDGKQTILNKTGTPFMTKGGTGDTLSGICGSLLAHGISPFTAACSAAFINGLAGELASRKRGPGTLSSDVLDSIPAVLQRM
jgi:hydroxyethylthiazole kinase-like uncharacterized protein yjeF